MAKSNKKVSEEIPKEEKMDDVEKETKGDEEEKEIPVKEPESTGEGEKEEEEEKEDAHVKYLRLMADFQNYKKRSQKERKDIHAYANEAIVSKLLDVMDNFERALDHEAEEGFKAGMVMIFDQLKEVLKKFGVEEIKAEHAEFDPNFHHAVMTEDSNSVESGKITMVLQKGYILNGKVIRPSMVKVAK